MSITKLSKWIEDLEEMESDLAGMYHWVDCTGDPKWASSMIKRIDKHVEHLKCGLQGDLNKLERESIEEMFDD